MKFKSVKVSEATHTRLLQDIAAELARETMDDAINRMLDHTAQIRAIRRNTFDRK